MKVDNKNEMLEFACKVCLIKAKEKQPYMVTCAWRYFDNEYCPHIEQALKERNNATL